MNDKPIFKMTTCWMLGWRLDREHHERSFSTLVIVMYSMYVQTIDFVRESIFHKYNGQRVVGRWTKKSCCYLFGLLFAVCFFSMNCINRIRRQTVFYVC